MRDSAVPVQGEAAPVPAPEPVRRESALVLFNERAGGVTASDRQRLLELLAHLGVRKFELTEPRRLGPDMFKQSAGHDMFVVLGGDGTARAAAQHAPKNAPPLILLPGGTLNMLPRALYGERAWPEALVAALERGRVERLCLGRANGEPFYVAAVFGEPTMLASAREAVRDHRYLTAIRGVRHLLKRVVTGRLRARPDGEPMVKASAVGVLCPCVSGGTDADHLEWARLDASGMLDLLRLGLRSFGDGWRSDPAIDVRTCRKGDIISLGLIPATLDGEPRTFVSRVRITFDPHGPKVIAVDEEAAA